MIIPIGAAVAIVFNPVLISKADEPGTVEVGVRMAATESESIVALSERSRLVPCTIVPVAVLRRSVSSANEPSSPIVLPSVYAALVIGAVSM